MRIVPLPSPNPARERRRNSRRLVTAAALGSTIAAAGVVSVVTAGFADAATASCEVTNNFTLGLDDQVTACGGGYRLVLQKSDGNLVLYRDGDGAALWSTGTSNRGVTSAVMQSDGNLVVYAGGSSVWDSHTGDATNGRLAVQGDGNLVIYVGDQAVWDRTNGRHAVQPVFVDHGTEGSGSQGYEVLDVERRDEGTDEDETTDNIPQGARAGDLVKIKEPGGNIRIYTVFQSPNPREIFNSTVLGASGGAAGNALKGDLESYYEKSPGKVFLDGATRVTKFVIGGAAGGLTGFVVGNFRNPNLFLVPGDQTNPISTLLFGQGRTYFYDLSGGMQWRP